jgi:hypothetical protein
MSRPTKLFAIVWSLSCALGKVGADRTARSRHLEAKELRWVFQGRRAETRVTDVADGTVR